MISRFRESFSWEKAAIAFLFLVGIVLRLRQYLTGRSLWVDEHAGAEHSEPPDRRHVPALDDDQGSPIVKLKVTAETPPRLKPSPVVLSSRP